MTAPQAKSTQTGPSAPSFNGTREQVHALEKTVTERAQQAARGHREDGEKAARRIAEVSANRLRRREERETSLARARAERERRRLVQSRTIALQAELEAARFERYRAVIDAVRSRLAALAEDEEAYRPVLEALVGAAAAAMDEDELQVTLNERDHRRFAGDWDGLARRAAPDKCMTLSADHHAECGGVILTGSSARVSLDQTFEGRLNRLDRDLYRQVLGTLFPEESTPNADTDASRA